MKKIYLILFILFSVLFCFSQTDTTAIFHLDSIPTEGVLLDKDWKFHAGDKFEWAKTDYSDNEWDSINTAVFLQHLPQIQKSEIGWLRLRLNVNSSLFNHTIAVVITSLCASEIYLNGQLIYKFGSVSADYNKEVTRFMINRPFLLHLGNQNKQTIAIRYSYNKKNIYMDFGTPPRFMELILKDPNLAFDDYLKVENFYLVLQSIQLSFYFPLGVLLFFLYFSYRRQNEYLYIGVFCVCMFFGMFFIFLIGSSSAITTSRANIIALCAHVLWITAFLFLLNGVYILLHQIKSWLYYFLFIYAILTVVVLFFFYDWAYMVEYIFVPIVYIELLRLYAKSLRRQRPGIWILLITLGLSCLGIFYFIWLLITNTNYDFVAFNIVSGISFASPSIGFSLFVAGEFARTAYSLQLRVTEVEDLSAKTITQEKEKMEAILEKQRAIENIRSKISMDIHDEIGSQLTKISLLSQRIMLNYENKKEVDANTINKITESSKEVVGNLGEIIWTVNPKHDNLQSLLSYIRNYITNFFEQTNIEYAIDFPEDIPATTISPDLKHNLFLVIKESLHNILKHADATEVKTSFQLNDPAFCFEIADNGKGIADMNGRDFGNGLINMKNRMEAVNGKFEIESVRYMGTKIILTGTLSS